MKKDKNVAEPFRVPPDSDDDGRLKPSATSGLDVQDCEKCEEYLAGWKRALADYDNLIKDLNRLKSDLRQSSKQDIIEFLLPVLDNFDQAVSHAPDELSDKTKNWLQGILHIKDQLESVLRDLGAEAYGAPGAVFDPHLHDAAGEVNDPNQDDQTIIQVTSHGWKIGEKIIRPAKVVINNIKSET